MLGASALLLQRIHSGELVFGYGRRAEARPSRMFFGGRLGALVEKDLRVAWREPALKAVLFFGLVGPLLFLYFTSRMRQGHPETTVLMLATFVGLSGFGANAFGLERRGVALLFAFPIERARVLVAKNLVALLFRLPALLTLGLAAVILTPPSYLPAAATIAFATILVGAGLDNFLSIWFPVVMPAPGRNPYASSSGGRGLGASLASLLMLSGVLLLSAPFTFLAWFPLLYGAPWLWTVTLPIAAGGALAVYAILVAIAARQLSAREPELLERMLGEE
jgi:ABC-2 type transport system permease protein